MQPLALLKTLAVVASLVPAAVALPIGSDSDTSSLNKPVSSLADTKTPQLEARGSRNRADKSKGKICECAECVGDGSQIPVPQCQPAKGMDNKEPDERSKTEIDCVLQDCDKMMAEIEEWQKRHKEYGKKGTWKCW
ncbi:hypothetical protein PspLS_10064 [Pyricularia sp. CBS 133598]|nr:hypothetical protein PspLS_10064 [Pyricularia sp. CBS 133598]